MLLFSYIVIRVKYDAIAPQFISSWLTFCFALDLSQASWRIVISHTWKWNARFCTLWSLIWFDNYVTMNQLQKRIGSEFQIRMSGFPNLDWLQLDLPNSDSDGICIISNLGQTWILRDSDCWQAYMEWSMIPCKPNLTWEYKIYKLKVIAGSECPWHEDYMIPTFRHISYLVMWAKVTSIAR